MGRQEYSPAEKSGAVKFVDMVGVVVVDCFEIRNFCFASFLFYQLFIIGNLVFQSIPEYFI